MPNPIQFQEHEFELTEVTFRCQHARLLFRPGDEFNLFCPARNETT